MSTKNSAKKADDTSLKKWIKSQYLEKGFEKSGFIGWKRFTKALIETRPDQAQDVATVLQE
jgi:hypothetical protein